MKAKLPLFQPSIILIETVRKRLKEVVQFQDLVIDQMCNSLLSKSFRDKKDERVLYAALFNGTSGCGKTTLAKEFARIIDEELKKELGPKFEFKFWKIDLGSWHSCEIPTLVGAFSSGWGASGSESRSSKFEEIMQEVERADPAYCRGVIFLDEIDKALKSDISNPSTAIDKLSELWENSSPEVKRSWAKRLRFGNFIILMGANFFTNSRNVKQAKIGFGITNDNADDLENDPNHVEPIDKEDIRKKLGEYLTVSSINRFDDIHIFENSFPLNATKKLLSEHFDAISEDIWIRFRAFDRNNQILPIVFTKPKAEDYLDEVYASADKEGGIRSLKRTLELRIKPKIMEFYLKQLSPENQYIFLQAQHAETIRTDLSRFKNARLLSFADEEEEWLKEMSESL